MNPHELQLPVAFTVSAVFFFALTGALAARRLGYDIIGIFVLAFATGVGGGLIRDTLLRGSGPVAALTDTRFSVLAIAFNWKTRAVEAPLESPWASAKLMPELRASSSSPKPPTKGP